MFFLKSSADSKPEDYGMQVASAMAIAGAVLTGWSFGVREAQVAIPLVGFAADLREFGILEAAKLFLIFLLVQLGKVRAALVVAAIFTFLYWLARYSVMGAFIPQVVFSCVFLALIWNLDAKAKQVLASIGLGGMFLFAALQKMNASYLAGLEFTAPDGFLSMFTILSGLQVSLETGKLLAVLSIGIELTLAVGLLMGKRIFAHLAVLFILFLSGLNSPVSFVYLCVTGLAVLADPKLAEKMQSLKAGKYFAAVSTWALVQLYLFPAYQLQNSGASWSVTLLRPTVFFLLFTGAHLYFLKQTFAEVHADTDWRKSISANGLAIGVLLSYFIAAHLLFHAGAPSPLGLSMFSSQVRKTSAYQLEFRNADDCRRLTRILASSIVADVRLHNFKHTCELNVPTESGLKYIENAICASRIHGTIVSVNKNRGYVREWKCDD